MIKQVQKTAELVNLSSEKKEQLTRKALDFLSISPWSGTPPGLAKELYSMLYREIGNDDPYKEIKERYNSIVLELEEELQGIIRRGSNSFRTAFETGNIWKHY